MKKLLLIGGLAIVMYFFTSRRKLDEKTEQKVQELHPRIRSYARSFIFACRDAGIELMIYTAYRSPADQNKEYAKGRTAPGAITTYVKGGYSYHQYGLALDVYDKKTMKTDWEKIGQIGKSFGFKWGGDWPNFRDMVHFEMPFGKDTSYYKTLADRNEFDSEGFVKIS